MRPPSWSDFRSCVGPGGGLTRGTWAFESGAAAWRDRVGAENLIQAVDLELFLRADVRSRTFAQSILARHTRGTMATMRRKRPEAAC